jgi:magnesium transporter
MNWINIEGLGDEALLRSVAQQFGVHPLAVEDIVNIPHRPSADLFDDNLLIVVRMVRVSDNLSDQNGESEHIEGEFDSEQVSILVGANYVVTFQDYPGDVLDPIRKRLKNPKSQIRRKGAGFLAYSIIDCIVDGYYPVLESIGNHLETLEQLALTSPSPKVLMRLNKVKNNLYHLRRAIWPQREAIHKLLYEQLPYFNDEDRIHIRDTYDHCVQTAEVIEMFRDMISELVNIYLSSLANRTNEIMKVLTIMTSIFIPLTFITGVYGMNFDYLPGKNSPIVFFSLCIAMSAIVIGMLLIFRWRKWI